MTVGRAKKLYLQWPYLKSRNCSFPSAKYFGPRCVESEPVSCRGGPRLDCCDAGCPRFHHLSVQSSVVVRSRSRSVVAAASAAAADTHFSECSDESRRVTSVRVGAAAAGARSFTTVRSDERFLFAEGKVRTCFVAFGRGRVASVRLRVTRLRW